MTVSNVHVYALVCAIIYTLYFNKTRWRQVTVDITDTSQKQTIEFAYLDPEGTF